MHAPSALVIASIASVIGLALGAWVSMFFVAQDLLRDRARIDRRDALAFCGLFAAAIAVRWALPVHTLVHENKHGYLVHPYLPLHAGVTPAVEGVVSGQRVLLKVIAYLVPMGREPVFVMNVAFSALAVAAMYALAKQLFTSRLAAWCAACLLLFQPIAILMAPTEEFLVSTSGLTIAGLALLWMGARADRLPAILAGACLVALGAAAREVTLPLSVLVPIFYFAATPAPMRLSFRRGALACGVVAAGLSPVAISTIVAKRAIGGMPAFIDFPHMPWGRGGRDPLWAGWHAPYVPRWMAWLGLLSILAMVVHAIRRPHARRAALAAISAVVIAQCAGGVVGSTWFPSILRHQLFAMTMLVLPAGFLLGSLERLPLRAAWMRAATFAVVPVLGIATLIAWPRGVRLDAPHVGEYRFFRDTLLRLPEHASAVVFARDPRAPVHLPEEIFWSLAPTWDTVSARNLAGLARRGSGRPVYLFLDRTCFMNNACIDGSSNCASSVIRDAQPHVQTRYGHVHARCAAALGAAPWTEIATRRITREDGHGYDVPSIDPEVTLAVLSWDGRAVAP